MLLEEFMKFAKKVKALEMENLKFKYENKELKKENDLLLTNMAYIQKVSDKTPAIATR